MRHPSYSVSFEPDAHVRVTADMSVPFDPGPPRVSIAIRDHTGNLQLICTPDQAYEIAAGIRDAVHIAEMERLGHDIAVAE
jgi:hypothetical protein